MALPYPTKVVLPFDIATAQDMNERHANDVALAAGTGLNDGAVTAPKIDFTTFSNSSLVKSFSNGSSNYSRNLTSFAYIDGTNAKADVNLVSGKIVRVDLTIAGLYNSNAGYVINFNIGVGSATAASTTQSVVPANWGTTWDTTGNRKVAETLTFFLRDIGSGAKSIYALWATSNVAATAYIGQFSTNRIIVTELL